VADCAADFTCVTSGITALNTALPEDPMDYCNEPDAVKSNLVDAMTDAVAACGEGCATCMGRYAETSADSTLSSFSPEYCAFLVAMQGSGRRRELSLSEGKIPDKYYKALYWPVCTMRSFCPPLDVSAYVLSFKTTLKSADDLDTPEEQLAARQSMVDSLNEEAGSDIFSLDGVGLEVDGVEASWDIETTSFIGKDIAEEQLKTASAEDLKKLTGVPSASGATGFTVENKVYPPPPPGLGAVEEGGGTDTGVIAGAAAGGVVAMLLLLVGVMFCMMRGKGGDKGGDKVQLKATASTKI